MKTKRTPPRPARRPKLSSAAGASSRAGKRGTGKSAVPASSARAGKRGAGTSAGAASSSRAGKRGAGKSASGASSSSRAGKRGAGKRGAGASSARAGKRGAGESATAASSSSRAGKRGARKLAGRGVRASRLAASDRWLSFVEQHGVVLASARGPVPSVAEAVAGQPIVGSWWAHPKGKAIFAALSELDDSDDIRCFKLVGGKVTFVHRRVWPALARLATDGVLAPARVASIQQEHMPTGEHRNLVTPFPDWVPDDVARAATALSAEAARAELGAWI